MIFDRHGRKNVPFGNKCIKNPSTDVEPVQDFCFYCTKSGVYIKKLISAKSYKILSAGHILTLRTCQK